MKPESFNQNQNVRAHSRDAELQPETFGVNTHCPQ